MQNFLHATIGRCSTELLHIVIGDAEFSAGNDWKMQHGFTAYGICSVDLLHVTIGGAEFSAGNDWKMQHGVTAYNDWRCRIFCM